MGSERLLWKRLHDLSGRREGEYEPAVMRHGSVAEGKPRMDNGEFRGERVGTILLAEDDESMRGLIQLVLEARGFRVLARANGLEALETYRKSGSSIQMVISDVGMPGLSGVDLFRELALLNPIVKMILISGHLDSLSLGQLRKAGLKHFIQKPFGPDQFLQAVDEVLAEP